MVRGGSGDRVGEARRVQRAGWVLLVMTALPAAAAESGAIDDPKDPMYWKPPKEKPVLREVLSGDAYEKRFAEVLKALDLPALEKSREPDRAARVIGITRGAVADRLGIAVGDFILELDGTPITDLWQFGALRTKQPQRLVWQTAAGERKEGEIPPGKIGIRGHVHDRPDLRYLRGKGRDSRWDREMVVALARRGADPDLAETCLARAIAAGYKSDTLDHAALAIEFAQARYGAVMDRAWLMLKTDAKDFHAALCFVSAAMYNYKFPAARRMLGLNPKVAQFITPNRATLDRLIKEHLARSADRRIAPPPSETAGEKLRDDMLLRAEFYGPVRPKSLPKDPFESHALTSYPGPGRALDQLFGPVAEHLEIRVDFSLRDPLKEDRGKARTFCVLVHNRDGAETNRLIQSHWLLWVQFTVDSKVHIRYLDRSRFRAYDERRDPAPQAGFDPAGDNTLRIVADAGRLEVILNGRRIFYGPMPKGDDKLFTELLVASAELRAKRFDVFELVDPDEANAPAFRDVNKKYSRGQTRLHRAAAFGPAADIPIWLARGADPNVQDRQGQTPLMLAAQRGRAEVVRHLLEKGADVSTADKKGKTALDHAKAAKQKAVVEVLQKAASK
jgi:hypothetical protein